MRPTVLVSVFSFLFSVILGCEQPSDPVNAFGESIGFKGYNSSPALSESAAESPETETDNEVEEVIEFEILESEEESSSELALEQSSPLPGDEIEEESHEKSAFSLGQPVSFTAPGNETPDNVVTLRVAALPQVVKVEYVAEDKSGLFCWVLGESELSSNGFQLTYVFNESGQRVIGARAFDGEGTPLGTIWKSVKIGSPAPQNDLQENYDVSFISPLPSTVTNPVKLSVATKGNIDSVRYLADSTHGGDAWILGDVAAGNGNFTLNYTFTDGGLRTLRAQARLASGDIVSEDVLVVDVHLATNTNPSENQAPCPSGEMLDCANQCAKSDWLGDGFCDDGTEYAAVFDCPSFNHDGGDCEAEAGNGCESGYVLDCVGNCAKSIWIGDGFCDDGSQYSIDLTCAQFNNDEGDCDAGASNPTPAAGSVPYFYQYANQFYPGSSCQNTSIAMLLAHYGWSGKPDTITQIHGKNKAQNPSGLAQVFNDMAAAAGMSQRLQAITNGSISGLKSLLASGQPVIVNGYFTSFGHVVLVTGYSNGTYTVNDPAGKWNQVFKGGYPYGYNSSIGKGIKYPASAFELAISSTNGSNFEPLWYYKIK